MQGTFKREDRTYLLSDERMAAFQALTPTQRLTWVEQMAAFLRKAAIAKANQNRDQPSNL
ncbi:hypothetical protein [Methylophilus sp. OH31]|uniref:hypothetical protein n=1 Tax=Methylophilus sp. OH31 TaxID=1387312 RepID=UPI000465F417|nr:hypothetical protein [Methylophilus sp. OH31]